MKIAVYGYGNLGKGTELAIASAPDAELVGVFTERAPGDVKTLTGAPVYRADDIFDFKDKTDVLIICKGSATELPRMTPYFAEHFNVVDSFDTHADIPKHFKNTDEAAKRGGKCALISAGWDPGMFSINRAYSEAILPCGKSYTFWGRGVSQGHSDAIRHIDGVFDARQYTVPIESAVESVRAGNAPELTAREKHRRECYVVAEDGADKARIEREIKEMPNYFADYDTEVNFITAEELKANHSGLPHGGSVIRTGCTGLSKENKATVEYSLKLDSNPEFTSGALLAFARAVYKASLRGESGCKTVLDIAPAELLPVSREELIEKLL